MTTKTDTIETQLDGILAEYQFSNGAQKRKTAKSAIKKLITDTCHTHDIGCQAADVNGASDPHTCPNCGGLYHGGYGICPKQAGGTSDDISLCDSCNSMTHTLVDTPAGRPYCGKCKVPKPVKPDSEIAGNNPSDKPCTLLYCCYGKLPEGHTAKFESSHMEFCNCPDDCPVHPTPPAPDKPHDWNTKGICTKCGLGISKMYMDGTPPCPAPGSSDIRHQIEETIEGGHLTFLTDEDFDKLQHLFERFAAGRAKEELKTVYRDIVKDNIAGPVKWEVSDRIVELAALEGQEQR